MKKHVITFIGHIAIAVLHYHLMVNKGTDIFQFISFMIAHYVWHNLIINRIYGLK